MADTASPAMLIGSRLVRRNPHDQRVREVTDPARDRTLAVVPEATEDETRDAVAAARGAFVNRSWSRLTPRERGDALLAVAAVLRDHADELTRLESLNVGKPVSQARGDIALAADYFDYFGRVIIDLPGEVIQNDDDQMTFVVRQPVGVVAAIVPWNFPLVVAATAVGPALAAGNTVVLKPSELTPLSALRLGELVADILPAGVLNIVAGGGNTVGETLTGDTGVNRIVFTGSTTTGKRIMSKASGTMKRIGLELGGKSPTVVLDDAPLEASVRSALQRIALNQGENCAAGSRLLVHKSGYDAFTEALRAEAAKLVPGDPQSDCTDIGPMISLEHRRRVESYVDLAQHDGQALYIGGTPDDSELERGFYVPVSIWNVGTDSRLWSEEVFGPVLAVVSYEDEDEAIKLANDTQFGLLATVWCGDRGRGLRVARRIDAGVVRINNAGSPLHGPWGGFKMSGIGRGYGRHAIEESTELKQINLDLT